MNITLNRSRSANGCTLGDLLVDGIHECWTCEDEVREWKKAGETAIPAGRYRIIVDFSSRFQRLLPLLLCVPGFTGIRIHPGNTAADTNGCILPGAIKAGIGVSHSREAFEALYIKIQAATQGNCEVWITIHNAPEVVS